MDSQSKPVITVITAIYNVDAYLNKFFETLLGSSFKDFKILCVNDGTKDNSVEIIESWIKKDPRIELISHENMGVYATHNTALERIDSPYFTFIDPDDWVDTTYLENLYKLAKESDADLTKGTLCRNYPDGTEKQMNRNAKIESGLRRGVPYPVYCCGSQWITILYRTEFVKNHGIHFMERKDGLEWDSDDIFLLTCLLHHPKVAICNAPGTAYHYFQRNTSAVHSINDLRFISTVRCREIEIELLNEALQSGRIQEPNYALVVKRVVWELQKHFMIYIQHSNFDKDAYLKGMERIINKIHYGNHLTNTFFSFVGPLLKSDYTNAQKKLLGLFSRALDKLSMFKIW